MSTAIAAVLNYYNGGVTKNDIREMTPDQFNIYVEEMGNVESLRAGEAMPSKDMMKEIKNDPAFRRRNGTRQSCC